jgi:hypothetical protein
MFSGFRSRWMIRADVDAGLAPEALRHRFALQVLHHEVELAVLRVAEVGDVDDVLVADLIDGLRLGHEPADDVRVLRELGVDRLHGDLLADDGVLGQIHDPHSPLTKLGGDLVIADRVADIDHGRRVLRPLFITGIV